MQARLVRYAAGFGELGGITNAYELMGGTVPPDQVGRSIS
jgi:hypothetical protein